MKKIICGNWKMNKTREEAISLVAEIEKDMPETENEVVVFPSFPYLEVVKNTVSRLKVGAQNCFYGEQGAFTGEVSPKQVKEYADYVLVGHSERRHIFGETSADIAKKTKSALAINLVPVVCVGETQEEKDNNLTENIIRNQIETVLNGLSKEDAEIIIVAYEPVWAIGTGNTCSKEDAENIINFIKGIIKVRGIKNTPVLYGGSVKADNAQDFFSDIIDGVLVGGASLESNEFIEIIKKAG